MDHYPSDELAMSLGEAGDGCQVSQGRVAKAVNFELCRMADRLMRWERASHTLAPGAPLDRAFDVDVLVQAANDRHRFAAPRAKRRILIDTPKNRGTARWAGEGRQVPSDDVLAYHDRQLFDVITRFKSLGFVALPLPGIAGGLDDSVATVEGGWRPTRARLRGRLEGVVA